MDKSFDELLDSEVSKKLRDEINPAFREFWRELNRLGYVDSESEGCAVVCRHLFCWLGDTGYKGGNLPDWLFKDSHINAEKLGDYGLRKIQLRKENLKRTILRNLAQQQDKS